MGHIKVHETISRHTNLESMENSIKHKKKVVWADNIEEVKTIPITKMAFNHHLKSKVMTMFDSLDKFMAICGNRGKSVRMKEFISMYEQCSKIRFDVSTFRALLSIFPDAFKVDLNENELHVTFKGGAKPSDVKERKLVLENMISEMEYENARYVDIVELPEIRKERYKTAKETIVENIIKFDNDDISQDEEDSKEGDSSEKFSSKFEELKQKIERKNLLKKRRENKF